MTFSAPCGYFAFSATTFTELSLSAAAFVIFSIASGLLFSMPMNTFSVPRYFFMLAMPSKMLSVFSIISLWSPVRYGSHSAAFITSVSTLNFLSS